MPSSSIEQIDNLRRIPTAIDTDDLDVSRNTASRMMSREDEQEMTRILTQNSVSNGPLPPMGPEGSTFPPLPRPQERYRIQFSGEDDPGIALNWPRKRQILIGAVLSLNNLMVSAGSAVYGAAMDPVETMFHIGVTPAALGISLYVLGFALGPILWGPLTETKGRKPPLVLGSFLFLCFTFSTATAKDVQTLLISRFFSGACGSSAIAIAPAIFSDMFPAATRGKASALYTLAVTGGPMVAPVAAAYIVNSRLSWRWTLYFIGIGSGLILSAVVLLVEETYQPKILAARAAELRRITGNWAIYAQHDLSEINVKKLLTNTIKRPLRMLTTEPILLLISIYAGFVYALLYMCLEAIPITFDGYKFKGGNVMLPYLAVLVGAFISIFTNLFVFEPRYRRKLSQSPYPVLPEQRLPLMMIGSVSLTGAIFWWFWTAAFPKTEETPHGIHWIAPVMALPFFGFGFIALFLPVINYILDSYLMLAASAMAGCTFLRSAMAASFPLFTTQMFHNLGIQWAGTLVGCLAVLMMPMPFLFFVYGAKLRACSRFAFNLEDEAQKEAKESDAANDTKAAETSDEEAIRALPAASHS